MTLSIQEFVDREYDTLIQTFALYLNRAGLYGEVSPVELLNEVVVDVMSKTDSLADIERPLAWFIKFGLILIKRHRTGRAKQQREPLIHDLYPFAEEQSEAELFDLINRLTASDPALTYERQTIVENYLGLLSEEERLIVELVVLQDLNSQTVGEIIGISAGAVRMRLYRALNRLRLSVVQEDGQL